MTIKLTIAITISAIISMYCFIRFAVNTYIYFIANDIQATAEYIDAIIYSAAYAFAVVFFASLAHGLLRVRKAGIQSKHAAP